MHQEEGLNILKRLTPCSKFTGSVGRKDELSSCMHSSLCPYHLINMIVRPLRASSVAGPSRIILQRRSLATAAPLLRQHDRGTVDIPLIAYGTSQADRQSHKVMFAHPDPAYPVQSLKPESISPTSPLHQHSLTPSSSLQRLQRRSSYRPIQMVF